MATFQSEYEDTTNTIDSIVSSQLSSVLNWINIPGGLTKVISSASGFAWGFNGNNTVWSCVLPCNGNWQSSDLSDFMVGTVLDIAADDTTVYILYTSLSGTTSILMTSANRQGSWVKLDVPISATKIFSTHTYLWAQDTNNAKQMCPKPCSTSNWIPGSENEVTITSSTNTQLFGTDSVGNALQTDETMRSGWVPISGFGETKVKSVVGSDTAVYAIDNNSTTIKYDGKTVEPISTAGYSPMNVTTGNNQLWMTSETPGSLGNIFYRSENPDYMSLVNTIAPLDKKRDELVSGIEKEFTQQTDVMTIRKQADDIIGFFRNIFKLDSDTAKRAKAQAGHINEQIRSTQQQLDTMKSVEPILRIGIVALLAISINYILLGGVLGWVTHIISVAIMGTGLYFILKSK